MKNDLSVAELVTWLENETAEFLREGTGSLHKQDEYLDVLGILHLLNHWPHAAWFAKEALVDLVEHYYSVTQASYDLWAKKQQLRGRNVITMEELESQHDLVCEWTSIYREKFSEIWD